MDKIIKNPAKTGGGMITMIALVNILLAFAALARDILLAVALGTTPDADAFVLAFSVPDIFANNLLAVSAAMAAIPLLTDVLITKGIKGFAHTSRILIRSVFAFSVVMLAGGIIFREGIIGLAGKGLDPGTAMLASQLLAVMLPLVLFFPLYTIGASISNIRNSFMLPSMAPVVFNFVFITGISAGLLFFHEGTDLVFTISASVVAGVVIMTAMVWTGIFRKGWLNESSDPLLRESTAKDDMNKYLRLLLPYLIVFAACQSVLYAERAMASTLGSGTISALNYAYRIAQLPTWIFIAALSTYALPSLSKLNNPESRLIHQNSMIGHLKSTFMISVPFSAAIFFLREPIVSVLLGRGAFDSASEKMTSGILAGYALAIIGQGIVFISLRFFLSMKYVIYPAISVILASVINIAADALLIRYIGYAGLGVGAAIGGTAAGAGMLILLNIRTKGLVVKNLTFFLKILLACAAMIPAAVASGYVWSNRSFSGSAWTELVFVCFTFIVLAMIYLEVLWLFKIRITLLQNVIKNIRNGRGDHNKKG